MEIVPHREDVKVTFRPLYGMAFAVPPDMAPPNRLVLAILRSRLHRWLSGSLVVLRLTGRRSGRTIELPVMYAHADDPNVLVVVSGQASTKRWWRNLRTPTPVTVTLAGRTREGIATLLEAEPDARGRALRAYLARFPKAARPLGLARSMSDAELGAAKSDFVVVHVGLEGVHQGASSNVTPPGASVSRA